MCYKCIIVNSKQEQELFLSLPKKLYNKKYLLQDLDTEIKILNKKHILSKNFEIYPYIVLDKNDNVVARCILTYYPNDTSAYLGYFECINDINAFKCLYAQIEDKVKKDSKNNIIGPIDCSFWIKYRFKANHFNHIYTGEPYNLSYYISFWKEVGFKITDNYCSNQLRVPNNNDNNDKYQKRLDNFIKNGGTIRNTSKKSFNKDLLDIYNLLIKLYSKFPGFKYITKDEFIKMFSNLKLVLDFNMVKLAFKDNKLVGFFISIPNYNHLTSNINLINIIKIFQIKKKTSEYVMLYMGVDENNLGLGSALVEIIKNELKNKNSTSIGALIHSGKVSNFYYKNLVIDKYEYVLMKKTFN